MEESTLPLKKSFDLPHGVHNFKGFKNTLKKLIQGPLFKNPTVIVSFGFIYANLPKTFFQDMIYEIKVEKHIVNNTAIIFMVIDGYWTCHVIIL